MDQYVFDMDKTIRIQVLAYRSGLSTGITLPVDVFWTANALLKNQGAAPLFDVRLVSVDGQDVALCHGLSVRVGGVVNSKPRSGSWLFVPGSAIDSVDSALDTLKREGDLIAWLRNDATDLQIAANCASTFLLAEAGLLNKRPATTTWWLAPLFRQRYPDVELRMNDMVVPADGIVTAGAAFAQADLALYVLALAAGQELAHKTAKLLMLEHNRTSQSRFISPALIATADPLVRKFDSWIRANLASPDAIASIAHNIGTTQRTLARRTNEALGLSPAALQTSIRMQAAESLISTTRQSMERIADQVGYTDATAFRRAFSRHVGSSPSELRQRQRATTSS